MPEPSSKYPRGRPFKPPAPEPADVPVRKESVVSPTGPTASSDAQLRSGTFRMAAGIVGSLVLVVIGVMVALKPSREPVVPSKRSNTKAPESRPVVAAATTRQRAPEEEEPKTGKAKLPVPVPVEPENATVVLQTLGSLTVANLYQTYLSLGLLADGVENGTYTDAEAQKMLRIVFGLIETVDQQLVKLSQSGVQPADRKLLERFRGLTGLLRTQATELRAYWDTSDEDQETKKDHETKFHRARQEAWAGIKELLGIKEE